MLMAVCGQRESALKFYVVQFTSELKRRKALIGPIQALVHNVFILTSLGSLGRKATRYYERALLTAARIISFGGSVALFKIMRSLLMRDAVQLRLRKNMYSMPSSYDAQAPILDEFFAIVGIPVGFAGGRMKYSSNDVCGRM